MKRQWTIFLLGAILAPGLCGCFSESDITGPEPAPRLKAAGDDITGTQVKATKGGTAIKADTVLTGEHSTATTNNYTEVKQFTIPIADGQTGKNIKGKARVDSIQEQVVTRSGTPVDIEILVLDQRFKWSYGSSTTIENDDTLHPLRFTPREYVQSLRENYFAGYDYPVVALGLASHEGNDLTEESRADLRASVLAEAVSETFVSKRCYKLVLGKHEDTRLDPTFSGCERRVVLIYAKSKLDLNHQHYDTEVEEAVEKGIVKALPECRQLDFDPNRYPHFRDGSAHAIPI